MEINKIRIQGFSNIKDITLSLDGLDSLIAFNNYGKSNVLRAIRFGIDFIKKSPKIKSNQMKFTPVIPINENIAEENFGFEITGAIAINNKKVNFIYGYSFEWIKNTEDKGAKIVSEYLKIKFNEEIKYKSFINRNTSSSLYLASETSRCSKNIKLETNQLALNKLENYDDLFYLDVIKQINCINIYTTNTLQNPDSFFHIISDTKCSEEYCLDMPKEDKIGYFIYSLKKLDIDKYELYKNSVKDLLPNIEDFECVEVNMKEIFNEDDSKKSKIPFELPEKIYDIRIKEKNINQQTSINYISSGSHKIFFVIAIVIAAEINNIPLITFEELENSIHPSLMQSLLITLDELSSRTKILTTSHSPYLLKYLELKNIKIGIPNNKGLAIFKSIRPSKYNRIMKLANDEGSSVGDYIFDMMLENDEEKFNEYFI